MFFYLGVKRNIMIVMDGVKSIFNSNSTENKKNVVVYSLESLFNFDSFNGIGMFYQLMLVYLSLT